MLSAVYSYDVCEAYPYHSTTQFKCSADRSRFHCPNNTVGLYTSHQVAHYNFSDFLSYFIFLCYMSILELRFPLFRDVTWRRLVLDINLSRKERRFKPYWS